MSIFAVGYLVGSVYQSLYFVYYEQASRFLNWFWYVILTFSLVCIAGSWEWRWKTDKPEVSLIYLSFWPGPSIGGQWATCKQEVIPKWHKYKFSVFKRPPLPLGLLFPRATLHRVLKTSHSFWPAHCNASRPRCVSSKWTCFFDLCTHGCVGLRCGQVHCWHIVILKKENVIAPLTYKI